MQLEQAPQAAAAVAGVATLNAPAGVITSEALTTAAGATYTLTLNNSAVTLKSVVMASIANGSNSAGDPSLTTVAIASVDGKVTIKVVNRHATDALNGTLKVAFAVFN